MADVHRAGRHADDEQPRLGRSRTWVSRASATSSGGIRTTTASRRRRAGLRRRDRAPLRRLRARSSARPRRMRTATTASIGLRPATTYAVCLDAPADSAAGGPLAGFELTGANAGADDADRLRRGARQRRAVHRRRPRPARRARSSRPTTSASGSRRRSATASGSTPNHNGIQDAGEAGVAGRRRRRCTTPRARRSRHTTTDANGLYLFDRLAGGRLPGLLRARHDPAGLRAHGQGRSRLDARERLRRRRRRLRRHHDAGPGPARPRLGRGHLEDPRSAPPSGGSTARPPASPSSR